MRSIVVFAGVVGVVLSTTSLSGQEWTRFRGPNGTGVSQSDSVPIEWTEDDYLWRAELPGIGHASPVVWGERVFTLSADPDDATRYVLCYDARNGKQLWKRDFPSTPHQLHLNSSYASSTPTVDAERVYVAWSTPEETTLKAFTHDGDPVWTRDLGRWVGQHGFGTSPILFENLVILHNSQQAEQVAPGQQPGQSRMMAFDRQTGRPVWETPLNTVRVSYSVPMIRHPPGQPAELICTNTGQGVFSLDPRTGRQNWALGDAFEMRVCSSPIVAGGYVFGTNGSGAYAGNFLVAVKPGPRPSLAYKLTNSRDFKAPYVPCAVARGDAVFLVYDRGFASCIDAPTGRVHWCERTGANFSGSPVLVGDRIYAIDEDGVVWVIAADTAEYRLLAKNPLGEASRATPAVAGGKMFLRTYSQLFCISGNAAIGG